MSDRPGKEFLQSLNERPARNFLQALRRLTRQVSLYPDGHPLTDEARGVLSAACAELLAKHTERALAVAGDSIYLDRGLLPHTSLEHNGLVRELQARNVQSLTLVNPVAGTDLTDLAMFVAGISDDLPAGGTIRLNEHPYADTSWDVGTMAELRRSYAGGLDALRSASYSVATEGACDLRAVMDAVQGFVGPSLNHASATLLLSTVKSHDEYTFYHSLNTCILAISLGRMLGLSDVQLTLIGAGAALHDIGKTGVPPHILNHPGRLSREQWKEMKIHPQEGAQAIMAAGGPGHEIAATIALEHHRRADGGGYPDRLSSGRPHTFSRLVTVTDIYDSVTTRRPYRRAYTPGQALQLLLQGAGSAFDGDMVKAFVQLMGAYPTGSLVRLSSGEVLMVSRYEDGDHGRLEGVVVRSPSGERIEPEPKVAGVGEVVDHLLPEEAGVDPASLFGSEALDLQLSST